ncbi:MAG: hypothetical protein N2645_22470 [Clostridia bacterium]|nr:hypothetical protein [Clostridia bacterium]
MSLKQIPALIRMNQKKILLLNAGIKEYEITQKMLKSLEPLWDKNGNYKLEMEKEIMEKIKR